MTDQGTFAISRKLFEHAVVGTKGRKFTVTEAWIWLIREASFKPRTIGRGHKVITLNRGQLSHSVRFIGDAWCWPRMTVHRFLRRLESETMIVTENGTDGLIITLCNYNDHQFGRFESGTGDGTPDGTRLGRARDKQEEGSKKVRKETPSGNPKGWPDDAFDQWWAVVAKRTDKLDAERAFAKLRASGKIEFPALLDATRRWSHAMTGREAQYIRAPSVWINKGGYLDETVKTTPVGALPQSGLSPETIARARNVSPSIWSDRVREYAENPAARARWSVEAWGPKPGSDGCLAPIETLIACGYAKKPNGEGPDASVH